ncbi:MAG: PLDc N-terminal domain-containing protein [Desulfobacterales bacterium]
MDIATAIFWIKISVVFYLLTVLAIFDIVRKDFGTIGKKALWGIIAMIPFIGWLIYLIFGFRKGKKPVREDP